MHRTLGGSSMGWGGDGKGQTCAMIAISILDLPKLFLIEPIIARERYR